jgi:hypothetical protein
MSEFAGSSRSLSESRKNEFHNVKVPPLKDRRNSPFWKLAMQVADEYKGKINPETKRKYTKEERIHIGISVAGKVAAGQRRRKTKR